jgi:hypothetical protein
MKFWNLGIMEAWDSGEAKTYLWQRRGDPPRKHFDRGYPG